MIYMTLVRIHNHFIVSVKAHFHETHTGFANYFPAISTEVRLPCFLMCFTLDRCSHGGFVDFLPNGVQFISFCGRLDNFPPWAVPQREYQQSGNLTPRTSFHSLNSCQSLNVIQCQPIRHLGKMLHWDAFTSLLLWVHSGLWRYFVATFRGEHQQVPGMKLLPWHPVSILHRPLSLFRVAYTGANTFLPNSQHSSINLTILTSTKVSYPSELLPRSLTPDTWRQIDS